MWKIILVALAATTLHVSAVAAQDDDAFYADKQIELFVGFNPGGTYDLYSRLAAEWLPRYIPGNPTVVVQNMPGAGGTLAANYLYSQASQDGLSIGMIGQAAALQQVIDKQGINYQIRDFNWIGRFTPVVEVTAVWNDSTPVRTIEDAKSNEVVLGATSAGSTSDMLPSVMNGIVGTNFDIVRGYQGTTGAVYAMENGEVQGAHSTIPTLVTQHADWLENDMISILVQYASEREPALPDVPAMTEFATNDDEAQILGLFASTAGIGRSLIAPPNVPEEQLQILRDAFSEMAADPEFKADLEERDLPFGPMSGGDLQAMVDKAVEVKEPVVARVVEIVDGASGD